MSFSVSQLPKSEIEIEARLSWDEWKKYVEQVLVQLTSETTVPGFRKGKVPVDVLEKHVGSERVVSDAVSRAIDDIYRAYVLEQKIVPVGEPSISVDSVTRDGELVYRVKTAVVPSVVMTDWSQKAKEVNKKFLAEADALVVSDKDIDDALGKIAESRAALVTVARPAKTGDITVIDFSLTKDGVIVENGTGKNHPLVLGSNAFIPGFEDEMIGLSANDVKEFDITFPKEYHAKHLADQTGHFSVTVSLVQERQIPEINDEFAKSLGKFSDVSALRKQVSESLLLEKKNGHTEKHRTALIDSLVSLSSAELPEIMVENELHKMEHEFSEQLSGSGATLDDYLAQSNKKREDLLKEWRSHAERRVLAGLILEKVADDRGVNVSADEVEARMNQTLAQYKNVKDVEKQIDLQSLYAYTKMMMTREAALEHLQKI
ncbi:MAG: trigger factor [Candidatus Moranbacteria bacterium]|nr:trigger factor [Candidatus Moranbacteria bacterium]